MYGEQISGSKLERYLAEKDRDGKRMTAKKKIIIDSFVKYIYEYLTAEMNGFHKYSKRRVLITEDIHFKSFADRIKVDYYRGCTGIRLREIQETGSLEIL